MIMPGSKESGMSRRRTCFPDAMSCRSSVPSTFGSGVGSGEGVGARDPDPDPDGVGVREG